MYSLVLLIITLRVKAHTANVATVLVVKVMTSLVINEIRTVKTSVSASFANVCFLPGMYQLMLP